MGKIIIFWSPSRGSGRLTSAMCALGCELALSGERVALTQVPGESRSIEELFDSHITRNLREEVYKRSGLTALLLKFKQEKLTSTKVRACGVKTIIDELDLFPCSVRNSEDYNETERKAVSALILNDLKEAYEYVLVDAGGDLDELSDRFMEKADSIVVCLPQSSREWKKFFNVYKALIPLNKTLFFINAYLKKSLNNVKRLEFMFFAGRNEINTIPLNISFMDAVVTGTVADFFMQNRNLKVSNEDYEFFKAVKEGTERLIGG